jgi:hypothetical protein
MEVSGQRHAPAALCPGENTPVPIVQGAGWAPEPVWTYRLEEKFFNWNVRTNQTIGKYKITFLAFQMK